MPDIQEIRFDNMSNISDQCASASDRFDMDNIHPGRWFDTLAK
jgi:hypothetical protein